MDEVETKEREYFGLQDVAEFCGVNASALYYHARKGHLVAHQKIGNAPMFLRSQVVEFRDTHYCPVGLTKKEVARMYGISPSLVQMYQERGDLAVLAGKRGRANLYDAEQADAVFARYKQLPTD